MKIVRSNNLTVSHLPQNLLSENRFITHFNEKVVIEMNSTQLHDLKIHHIGVVVKDIHKAVEYYSKFKFSPFRINTSVRPSGSLNQDSQDQIVKLTFAAARMMGSMALEFIQVEQGKPFYLEFLNRQGEGMHHLAFVVDEAEAVASMWEKKGVPIVAHGPEWAYLDFGYDVLIEFISRSRLPNITARLFFPP